MSRAAIGHKSPQRLATASRIKQKTHLAIAKAGSSPDFSKYLLIALQSGTQIGDVITIINQDDIVKLS